MMAFRNPLQWPTGQPRTERRRKAPFNAGETTILQGLDRAVLKLELEDVQITTDRRVRVDGQISQSSAENAADPGIAIYFKRKGEDVIMAFDKFNDFWGNLRAIGLYLEYMARLESYEMAEIADRAFTGFKALPASITTPLPHRDWWVVLGVSQDANALEVKAAYRELLKLHHPDAGGNQAELDEVRRAFEEWKQS
jgi:hypothetical protein